MQKKSTAGMTKKVAIEKSQMQQSNSEQYSDEVLEWQKIAKKEKSSVSMSSSVQQQSSFVTTVRLLQICKVLSLLEACFDLISGSSLSIKIQIMGGKIIENGGSNLCSRRSFFLFFLSIFKFFTQKWISLILTIF